MSSRLAKRDANAWGQKPELEDGHGNRDRNAFKNVLRERMEPTGRHVTSACGDSRNLRESDDGPVTGAWAKRSGPRVSADPNGGSARGTWAETPVERMEPHDTSVRDESRKDEPRFKERFDSREGSASSASSDDAASAAGSPLKWVRNLR